MKVRWVTLGLLTALGSAGFGAGFGYNEFRWQDIDKRHISAAVSAALESAKQAEQEKRATEERRVEEARQEANKPNALLRQALLKLVVDPGSLQVRNAFWHAGNLCGEYNSKNRMGGYTGFQWAILTSKNDLVLQEPFSSVGGDVADAAPVLWRLYCKK